MEKQENLTDLFFYQFLRDTPVIYLLKWMWRHSASKTKTKSILFLSGMGCLFNLNEMISNYNFKYMEV
jgi:hypothetical protein